MIGRLHTNIFIPVDHGDVAGVHMNANAIARFSIASTTDCMETLQNKAVQTVIPENKEGLLYFSKWLNLQPQSPLSCLKI